jgi:hypothetical protein
MTDRHRGFILPAHATIVGAPLTEGKSMDFTPDDHCSRCHRCNELEAPYERAQEARFPRYQYRYRCKGCGNRWQISRPMEGRICKAYVKPVEYLGGILGNTTYACTLPTAYGHEWHESLGPDPQHWTDRSEGAGYQ